MWRWSRPKNCGSLTGHMKISGCWPSWAAMAEVPAFGAPTMKKSGLCIVSRRAPRPRSSQPDNALAASELPEPPGWPAFLLCDFSRAKDGALTVSAETTVSAEPTLSQPRSPPRRLLAVVRAGLLGAAIGTLMLNASQAAFSLISTLLLTHALGPRGFGAYSF